VQLNVEVPLAITLVQDNKWSELRKKEALL
jgi:hypothetical protein